MGGQPQGERELFSIPCESNPAPRRVAAIIMETAWRTLQTDRFGGALSGSLWLPASVLLTREAATSARRTWKSGERILVWRLLQRGPKSNLYQSLCAASLAMIGSRPAVSVYRPLGRSDGI